MRFEWLLLAALLLLALVPIARRLRSGWAWAALLIAVGLTTSAAAFWQKHTARQMASRSELLAKTPKQERPGGYLGSDSCQACHPGQYDSWHKSFHRTMTQHATPESVRGNFDNTEVMLADEKYLFQRRGDEYWVEM